MPPRYFTTTTSAPTFDTDTTFGSIEKGFATMRTYTDINNIDFSIIREKALNNIREDLINDWSGRFTAADIDAAFNAVVEAHRANAVIEDFLPVLVENEMKNRLLDGNLHGAAA